MRKSLFFALFAAALCGCATIESSTVGERHMVSIKNTGWYFLTVVPLASGDHDCPNELSTKPFTDSLSLKNNMAMIDGVVERTGATGFRNLTSTKKDESVLFFLLSRYTYHTSAELVFNGTGRRQENQQPCR